MQKTLKECDVTELRAIAEQYGLEFEKSANSNHLRKLLIESTSIDPDAVDVPVIELEEEDVQPDPGGKGRIKVIFPTGDGVYGKEKIKVGVNGKRYAIPRETVVSLPQEVLHVLDNAIIDEMHRDENGEYQARPRKRYVYQRV